MIDLADRHGLELATVSGETNASTLGFVRMVLAQSQLLNGEPEAAATTAIQAVAAADALQSTRFQRYVMDFQREISPHSGSSTVQQFNEQVREAMARMGDEE